MNQATAKYRKLTIRVINRSVIFMFGPFVVQ